jgi:hypothetical protein
MCRTGIVGVVVVLSLLGGTSWSADVILNEYNAVGSADFLGGGDSSADESAGRASDSYFGRVPGNGGDWFELVVIKDQLDMRGWQLDTFINGKLDKTLILTAHPVWSNLRSGTIITVAQKVPSDISYDPAAGDWWINVEASKEADGLYITASNFDVSSNNWQLRIRNVAGTVVFGPAGEGVSPRSGVGSTEVFFLKGDPDASVTSNSADYDTNKRFSTFGAPNRWGVQDFNDLRPALTPKPWAVAVLAPNGTEVFAPGDIVTVQWSTQDVEEPVLVEFSIDNGYSWSPVYPPNVGNTGTYKWLVPLVDTDQALIRVSSTTRPAVWDASDKPFAIVQTTPVADLSGDGIVDFLDFALTASAWLNGG